MTSGTDASLRQPIDVGASRPARGMYRGSALFFAARVLGAGLTYGAQLLLARWMGSEQLGSYVAAFSWCLVLTNVAMLGLPRASLRFVSEYLAKGDAATLHGFVRRSVQLVTIASVVLGVGAAALVVTTSPGGVRANSPLLIAMLSVPFLALIGVYGGLALALSWKKLFILPMNVLRPALFFVGIVVAFVGWERITALHAISIHGGVIVALSIATIAFFSRSFRQQIPRAVPRFETRSWVATTLPLMLVSLYGSYFLEFNVILLDTMLPSEAIGVFGPAHRTAFLIGFVLFAVDSATLPRISRLHGEGQRARMQVALAQAARLKTLVAASAFALMVLFGRQVLMLFGPEFAQGYVPMLVLAGALVLRAATGPVVELLGVTGHHHVSLIACVGGLLVTPGLHALLVPSYGLAGAAWTVFCVLAVTQLWLHREVRRRLGIVASVTIRS